ncbi:hypothetical protein [Algoriphagus sp.]|uniref:hypothetical protein n=1 Tax=Algoriphagus sp. TaxID=1872435 RepID=UPI003297A6B0
MNCKSLLSILLALLFFSCSPSPEKQAQELIEKSLKAHQLSKNWGDVATIKFKKVTSSLDESGALENESEQWVEFRLKPYFEAKLTWTKDSILHVVNFNGSKTSYQMGDNSIQNEGFLKAKRAEIDAAFFAFAQPWSLLDENTSMSYEGQKTLENGEQVELIQVGNLPSPNPSWVYFDPVTFKVKAMERLEKDQKTLVENTSYDESTGLLFPKKQNKYRTDDAGKALILQAEYLYSDFEVTFE